MKLKLSAEFILAVPPNILREAIRSKEILILNWQTASWWAWDRDAWLESDIWNKSYENG